MHDNGSVIEWLVEFAFPCAMDACQGRTMLLAFTVTDYVLIPYNYTGRHIDPSLRPWRGGGFILCGQSQAGTVFRRA